jgi:hypothetical protein
MVSANWISTFSSDPLEIEDYSLCEPKATIMSKRKLGAYALLMLGNGMTYQVSVTASER